MNWDEFTGAIDKLVREGLVTCVCAECDKNVTAAYMNSIGGLVKCENCNTNLNPDTDILFKNVKPN